MPLFSFSETISLSGSDQSDLFTIKEVKNAIKKTVAVVGENHYAIFIKNGEYVEILGEGKHQVVKKGEKNVSVLLIYVSMSASLHVKWAIPREEFIGLRGEIEVKIGDIGKAYKEIEGGSAEKLQLKLRSRICNEIRPMVARILEERGEEVLGDNIELGKALSPAIAEVLQKDYGLKLVGLTVEKAE